MRRNNREGFTLIEIMLVLLILGILAAMVAPNLSGKTKKAQVQAAKVDIDANLATALDLYEVDNGRYPTTEQGLGALVELPTIPPEPLNWNGPYLKRKRIPKDPWQTEYIYASPGQQNSEAYDLSSYGPDRIQSEDDITNWGE
jgi:general secretion pathway protein G